MALVKETLKTAIELAFSTARTGTDRNDTLPQLAQDLADAIDAYIKSGDVQTGITSTGADPQGGVVTSSTTTVGKIL